MCIHIYIYIYIYIYIHTYTRTHMLLMIWSADIFKGTPAVRGRPEARQGVQGQKICAPEIDTSEIIVDFQWHFPMDFERHFPTTFHFCDFWCAIFCPEGGAPPVLGGSVRESGHPPNGSGPSKGSSRRKAAVLGFETLASRPRAANL